LPGADRPDRAVRGEAGAEVGRGALSAPDLRRDPLTGRLVAVAPGRALRPGAGRGSIDPPSEQELADCPFCGGREDRTPPHTLVLPGPDWQGRVGPNLYPAVQRPEGAGH